MTTHSLILLGLLRPVELWPLETWILLAIGAAGIVLLLFRADDRVESRRRKASRAASECREIGDDVLARLLEAYAVGDYSGVTHELHDTIKQLIGESGIGAAAMRRDMVKKLLPKLLEDPNHRDEILRIVNQDSASETVSAKRRRSL